MVELPSKVLIFSAFLCVYIYEIKGRPNNFDDVTEVEDQNKFEESDLLKKSKTNTGGQDKGMNLISQLVCVNLKMLCRFIACLWP